MKCLVKYCILWILIDRWLIEIYVIDEIYGELNEVIMASADKQVTKTKIIAPATEKGSKQGESKEKLWVFNILENKFQHVLENKIRLFYVFTETGIYLWVSSQ